MNEAQNRDVAVFTEALQLPAVQRAAYLERACGSDEALRLRVEALLHAHETVGDFLEQSPQKAAAGAKQAMVVGEKPGDCVGRYKLLQQIGEGGCGVVFMAEQQEPVRRQVALKIIRPGMDTKSVIARFEAERQALALMDHPNIAKVFDAGATESSRPFFVMELVRGIKITEYCDQNSLTTEERLRLFIQVCQAVQHAHQKGIIHRDIKPSNILVTTSLEGVAMPVVIDFGIAKATTSQRLTDKTLFTAFEMLLGTPAYMSPEQAALTSVDVDTRTDIYSLGVLLYELLAGSTPFDTGELLKAGLDEIRRVIREDEPVRPSTRLGRLTGADLTMIARHRQVEPPRLIRTIRGDLDWIAMKALEKDRTRRYETANGLAMDVQRYLANEPIVARPPSKLYKLKKTVLRHKFLFLGGGIVAALLILGLILVSTSLARELRASREADAARIRAEAESFKSRQVTQFLEDMLQGVGPSVALGRDTTMLREILDRTAKKVGAGLTNQPEIEAELRRLIGQLYWEIGKYEDAEKMDRAALAITERLFGRESRETAAALSDLGIVLWKEGNLAEAEVVQQRALTIRQKLFGDDNADVAVSLSNLADVYRHQKNGAAAEKLARKTLAIRQELFGRESLEAATSLRILGIMQGDAGNWAESEALSREVLAIRRKLLGPEHALVAASLNDLAWAVGAQGRQDEAENLEGEALAMRQKLLGGEHPDVAKSFFLLGERMRRRGELTQANSFLTMALTIQTKVLGEENQATLDTMRGLGLMLEAQGKLAESEEMHRKALTLWRRRGESESPLALAEYESLGRLLMSQKKFAEAEQLLNEVLIPDFTRQPASAFLLTFRGDLRARLGLWPQATADFRQAFENQPIESFRFSPVAALLVKINDLAAYGQLCKRLLAANANTTNVFVADQVAKACLFRPGTGVDLQAVGRLADLAVSHGAGDEGARPFFQLCKALAEYRQGHYAGAVTWAQSSLSSGRADVYGHAYAVLAMAYWRMGQKAEAGSALAKGNVLAPVVMPENVMEQTGNAWQAWLFARIQLDEAAALIQPGSSPKKE